MNKLQITSFVLLSFISYSLFSVYSSSQMHVRIPNIGTVKPKLIVGVNYCGGAPESRIRGRDLPLLKDIGIKHIRLGAITTANIEEYDALVNLFLENGIDVIATFAEELDFGDYVHEIVDHFKARIRAWIVFNEANWNGYKNNPAGYVDKLKIAYVRAKDVDPSVLVLTTNLLSTDSLGYLREMYKNGAKDYFDVLAIDPYCQGVSPLEPNRDRWGHSFWEVPKFRDLMVEYGDDKKKIWIIEMGWRTPDPYGWFYVGDGKGTVSETTQALYIRQALELAATWSWLERYYHYEWMDSYDPESGYHGLIRERYNPPYETKPSFDIVKDFTTS